MLSYIRAVDVVSLMYVKEDLIIPHVSYSNFKIIVVLLSIK